MMGWIAFCLVTALFAAYVALDRKRWKLLDEIFTLQGNFNETISSRVESIEALPDRMKEVRLQTKEIRQLRRSQDELAVVVREARKRVVMTAADEEGRCRIIGDTVDDGADEPVGGSRGEVN